MRNAKRRGPGADRVVMVSLIGSLAIALAGCGGDNGMSAATGAAATSNTSASSTTSTTVADTTGGSTNTTSGSTTTTTTTPTGTSTTTTGTSTVTPPPPPPAAATTSSITLGWVPPSQNSDGSPITNLAGFKIHYGTTSSEYTQTIALENAGLTRYVLDNLPSGTYYFAITAYNSQGIESPMSGEVTTTVD